MADISPAAPDFRKLCDEQLPELRGMFERILCVARSSGGPAIGNIQLADRLIDAVVSWSDAALAQPEPEGPTDEELMQLLFDNYRDDIEFVCDAEEEAHVMANSHVKFARAVLTRRGLSHRFLTMLFKVDYRDLNPTGDVIGRGLFIEADSLEQASRLAQERCRADEELESVRRFARGEVA